MLSNYIKTKHLNISSTYQIENKQNGVIYMEKIINLTPHPIIMDGKTYPSEGSLRVSVETQKIEGTSIPLSISKFGQVLDLPEEKRGTLYIVSRMVAEATKREDFLIVNETIRDDSGRIRGCKSLSSVVITNAEELKNYILHWTYSDGEYSDTGLDKITPLKELFGELEIKDREVRDSYFSKSSDSYKGGSSELVRVWGFQLGGKRFYLQGIMESKILDSYYSDVSEHFINVINYISGAGPKEKAIREISNLSDAIMLGEFARFC
jgi:hypothetical protein